ncbi:XRE family transcriptional regulator [Brucella tritici]|uniref:XRE family transcriptional regulator n=1 Tax=Brucella tritici TaxID=94626 RepID=UPI001591E894|nr:XRE family transcriptional regulator [Brucella tritici]
MITGPQCRAGRALVEITRAKLSRRSGVDDDAIEKFERKLQHLDPGMVEALQSALEALGAVFINENGGGIGVRLKFTESEARRIARLEGEGGLVASNRVP